MKLRSLTLFTLALLPLAAFAGDTKNCGCDCCKGKEVCCCHAEERADAKPAPKLHPLTGIVIEVLADRQALLVKHNEIPGVMRAMTMMFRVEADVLAHVKQGDAIKARMGRDENNKWILRDVAVVAQK